jgi:hypothetical protein
MDPLSLFERVKRTAIALLIETHCVAREPIERWPVGLKMGLPTDTNLDETVESAFERYRAEAIMAWNLISDPPQRFSTTPWQPLYTSKTPSTSSSAFEINLLPSLYGELVGALTKVRMIGTLLRNPLLFTASQYYDPQFTSLKLAASELSSRFDLLRCYFTNLSY